MKYIVVSVFDKALGAFGRPLFVQSVGVATRSFSDEVNRSDRQNEMNQHPEDFTLFELGEFDDMDASFSLLNQPRMICRASDLLKVVN